MDVKFIITHPGIFHADDVFAVAWLLNMLGDIPVERRMPTEDELRDPAVIVVDVGGQYNAILNNYDHHQIEGAGCHPGTDIRYASFGLVFEEFGPEFHVHEYVRENLVQAIDAWDNGHRPTISDAPILTISEIISAFNTLDCGFDMAVTIARDIISVQLARAREVAASKSTVRAAEAVNGVLVLTPFAPGWQDHIVNRADYGELQYVVFPSLRGGFNVQQIPGKSRLPKEWAGLRDEELQAVTGASDASFCHNNTFIAGAASLEGALELAHKAVEALGEVENA